MLKKEKLRGFKHGSDQISDFLNFEIFCSNIETFFKRRKKQNTVFEKMLCTRILTQTPNQCGFKHGSDQISDFLNFEIFCSNIETFFKRLKKQNTVFEKISCTRTLS